MVGRAAASRFVVRRTREVRSGEGRRKWNGEKARYEARYFPHGERSLFTSPLSESAPTGASEKKFRFSCAVKVTPASVRARAYTHHTSRAATSRSHPRRNVSSINYFAK